MKKLFTLILLLCFSSAAWCQQPMGGVTGPSGSSAPVISSLTYSQSASTIVATWTTNIAASTACAAGAKAGIENSLSLPTTTSHECIVTGLNASTGYSCTVTSGTTTSSPSTVTTNALDVRTPISSAAFGSSIVSAPTANGGDYPFTFVSNDGREYIGQDDGYGLASSANAGANFQMGVLTSPSTMIGTNTNLLTAYGGFNTFTGTDCTNPSGDPMTNKQQGLFGMSGNLYLFALRICNEGSLTMPTITYGNVIMSANHGTSWNNYTATSTFDANGNPPAQGSYQFPSSNIGSVNPVRYAADDDTIGYLTVGNRIDGADAYVYMTYKLTADITNEYLMRQPRVLFEAQSTSGIQFWDGTPSVANFINDSDWTSTLADATAIYSASSGNAYIGEVTFIPGLNGYMLLNTYRPTGSASFSTWNFFYGPTPAGPWTQIAQQANAPTGYYSPTLLHSSVIANSSTANVGINFLFSGDPGTAYWFHNQGLTLNANTLTSQQLVSFPCNTSESPVSDGGNFSTMSGFADSQATATVCEMATAGVGGAVGGVALYTAPPMAGDTGAPWPADQCSELTIGSIDSGGYMAPAVRMGTGGSGYFGLVGPSGSGYATIYKITGSGTVSAISSAVADNANANDVWKLCVSGTTLTLYQNSGSGFSSVVTATDSTYASGDPGWYQYAASAATDSQIMEWDAIANQAAAPTFSSVTTPGTITVSSATSSATCYYTLDGTQPTRSSSSISCGSTVSVSGGQTLRAMAAATDYADSGVTTVTYPSFSFLPVYQASNSCTSGGNSCTVSLSVQAGWFAVCAVGSNSVPTNTLSCSAPDVASWTSPSGNPYLDSGVAIGGLSLGTITATTTETFTCNATNDTNNMGCSVAVFSGTPTSGWDVALAGANNTGTTSLTSGTTTNTTAASELAVAVFTSNTGGGATLTGTGGWTCPTSTVTYPDNGICYLVLTSTGAQTATASQSPTTANGLGAVSTIK